MNAEFVNELFDSHLNMAQLYQAPRQHGRTTILKEFAAKCIQNKELFRVMTPSGSSRNGAWTQFADAPINTYTVLIADDVDYMSQEQRDFIAAAQQSGKHIIMTSEADYQHPFTFAIRVISDA